MEILTSAIYSEVGYPKLLSPAIGLCVCGKTVELWSIHWNECKCGRSYDQEGNGSKFNE